MDILAWADEEFGGADVGDLRRQRRLVRMAARVAQRPGGKVTEVFNAPAEREGAYRLLSNDKVDANRVAESTYRACVRRCAGAGLVFVAEDGSSLGITDEELAKGTGPVGAREMGGRGFQVLTAIAVNEKGVPLGVCAQSWWARSETPRRKRLAHLAPEEKETHHWIDVMRDTRRRFGEVEGATPWFQMDRGADCWPVWKESESPSQYVTVRSCHDRRLASPPGQPRRYLRAEMQSAPIIGHYALPVPGGPNRKRRVARMQVRALPVALRIEDGKSKRVTTVRVHAVWTREVETTPKGEPPIDWQLLTTYAVEDFDSALLTIFGYSQRWRIEEFHRAWKTGISNVEDTQLRSPSGIRIWATLLAAAAMRLLRMTYLSRHEPTRPASVEFSHLEIHAIHVAGRARWDERRMPTIAEITHRVAQIGGYTGKSSGGPPGFIVLARGWQRIEPIIVAIQVLRAGPEEAEK